MHAPPGPRNAEEIVAVLAGRQHGVVARSQLLAGGVSADAIDRRVQAGRLRALHRGVYLAGPTAPPLAAEMAAALACGPSAVLSHGTAARLWRIPGTAAAGPIEVMARAGDPRKPGLLVRRVTTLRVDEVTTLDGIPITTPARTLYDLAGVLDGRGLERALAEALALRLTTPQELRRLLARHPRGPGSPELRALLDRGEPARTRSEAEERLLDLVRRGKLPEPEVNVRVAGHQVDLLWRKQRLVVEVDGFAFHSSQLAFERDRRRDAELMAAGLRVMRVTWRRLQEEPDAALVDLVRALGTGGWG